MKNGSGEAGHWKVTERMWDKEIWEDCTKRDGHS